MYVIRTEPEVGKYGKFRVVPPSLSTHGIDCTVSIVQDVRKRIK